jgi:hypothetical protein
VADAVDFRRIADDALVGIGEQGHDARHAFAVGGQGASSTNFCSWPSTKRLWMMRPAGSPIFSTRPEARRVKVDVFEIHELVFDGGAAGVDDEDFHDGKAIAWSGENKRAG